MKGISKKEKKMSQTPDTWSWVLQQKPDCVSVGDIALVNGTRFVCIEIDQNEIATWDDAPFVDIKHKTPHPNTMIKVRCLHEGKWVEQVIHEKYLSKVKSERVEWMPCNS
jgi:hypothetical protein